MVKIIFFGDTGCYKKGQIVRISAIEAQYYIDRQMAGVFEFAKKPAPAENKLLKPKRQNKKRK
jgi:hypothetical protein